MILVIVGPSGSGKTTIRKKLISKLNLPNLINVTTRKRRPGEIEGVDYLYVSKEQFKRMVAEGELLEWVEYSGNYYGLKKNDTTKGITILETEGALRLKKMFPDKVRIVYLQVSEDMRRKRMLERGDSPEEVSRRLGADSERFEDASFKEQIDLVVCNINLEDAVREIEDYYGLQHQ